jgi:hypothetical protein
MVSRGIITLCLFTAGDVEVGSGKLLISALFAFERVAVTVTTLVAVATSDTVTVTIFVDDSVVVEGLSVIVFDWVVVVIMMSNEVVVTVVKTLKSQPGFKAPNREDLRA